MLVGAFCVCGDAPPSSVTRASGLDTCARGDEVAGALPFDVKR